MYEDNPALKLPYDIRGTYPDQVNEEMFERIGRAFAAVIKPKTVVVGRDVRIHGPQMQKAIINGLLKSGVDVVDIGVISTEMLYFAVGEFGYDGGISVTASHNPAEYNGTKFVKKGSVVLSPDGDFKDVKELIKNGEFKDAEKAGNLSSRELLNDYIIKITSMIDLTTLKPLKIVVNPNFGADCMVLKELVKKIPFELIPLNAEADGNFPKGRPDPLVPENRAETSELIKQTHPAFGVTWDADGDRCFFYDENGDFVDGSYMVALVAKQLLKKHPGEKILHEQRVIWAASDTINENGGKDVIWRAGNVFMKEGVRTQNAIAGIEMSGHYFWRDLYYCDNGLLAFIMVWQMVSEGNKLSELVKDLRQKYFVSGEVNFTVKDRRATLDAIVNQLGGKYRPEFNDGEIVDGRNWRANVRPSDTEPLLRINVEGKNQKIVDQKMKEITEIIHANN
jgi:phosphomannomutase